MIKRKKERACHSLRMDKDFKSINSMYLSQPFADDKDENELIAECRMQARTYAVTENAIVSMGDNKLNCSYCYFGGLADVLGLTAEERQDVIPSLYEGFIFHRADADDLARRHADELAFVHMLKPLAESQRRDFYLSDFIRLRDKDGNWRMIEHRMFPMASTSNGSFRLMACVYTLARGDQHQARIINTRTGDMRILSHKDYENILTKREREVLRYIDQGKLSKEIADLLSISINTVNRHRQNILEKLNVDHAIEACKVARAMGIV